MNEPLPARLSAVAEEVAGLRRAVAQMQSQWPADAEFDGEDATGMLRVTIAANGDVLDVHLDPGWQRALEARELGRAVNQAAGQASATLAVSWIHDAKPASIDLSPAPTTHPNPSLDEYRAKFPAPETLADLDEKFALAAAARAEYRRFKDELADLDRRERFRSPAGFFDVIRSRGNLLGLETEPDRLTFQDPQAIATDIRESLDEIRRRAADDDTQLIDTMPSLAEVRERTALRLAALSGRISEGNNA